MSDLVPVETLVHVGFGIVALGLLVRDMFWLRLLTLVAYSVFCLVAFNRIDGPAWDLLAWYTAFIAINGGHAAYLFYERRLRRLSAEEQKLFDVAFPMLDRLTAKRLMRKGEWQTLVPGKHLTRENQVSERLFLIAEGRASVTLAGRPIAMLGPGQFVGEIGFIANQAAGATAVAVSGPEGEGVRCLTWKQTGLRRRLAQDPELRSVAHAAIGTDLARKILEHNLNVTRAPSVAEAAA